MNALSKLERHPLSADYGDLGKKARAAFVANLREHGILDGRKVTLHDGKVLDGWQFLQCCLEADITPDTQELPKGWTPEDFVATSNDHRRHESKEAAAERVKKRRERVAAGRAEGASLRTLAEEEGVSESQVRKDLEAEATQSNSQLSTSASQLPETTCSGAHRCAPDDSEPAEVTGKDGKKYKAKAEKKLCPKCQRSARVGQKPERGCSDCAALNRKKASKANDFPFGANVETAIEKAVAAKVLTASQGERLAACPTEKHQAVIDAFAESYEAGKKKLKAVESGLDDLPTEDDDGATLPEQARLAFAEREKIKVACKTIDALIKDVKAICDGSAGLHVHFLTTETHLKNAKQQLWQNKPDVVCPYCKGLKKCETCKSAGWLPKRKAADHGQGGGK